MAEAMWWALDMLGIGVQLGVLVGGFSLLVWAGERYRTRRYHERRIIREHERREYEDALRRVRRAEAQGEPWL